MENCRRTQEFHGTGDSLAVYDMWNFHRSSGTFTVRKILSVCDMRDLRGSQTLAVCKIVVSQYAPAPQMKTVL